MTKSYEPLAVIIEDDQMLADIFSRTLGLISYRTETIGDGTAAMAWLANNVPDLLILDLHLPGLSGDRILEAIKKDRRLDQVKIMIITADSTMLNQLNLTDRKVFTLVKPVYPIQLQLLAERLKPD